MFLPRVLFRTLAPMLVLGLLLGGCIMPARQDGAPTQPSAKPPVDEPAPEMPAEDLIAVVSQDANVRTGPSTDHAIAYWLAAGAEVTVVVRNEEGTWLRIEHEDRPGWIFAALTDVAAEGVAELPADAPPAEPPPESVPEPVVEPTPETVDPTLAPTPEPAPEPETPPAPEPSPSLPAVTVVGTVVNLRTGPGTNHPTDGQVRAGDELHATGRNADSNWLQVEHPTAPAEQVWIYAPLTDIDGATVQTLADVSASAVEVSAAPEPAPEPTPEPVAPTPTPVPVQEPAALPPAQPVVSADCTRLHTVNPNETRLQQITDWFGLDLNTVATLNGIAPDTPLTSGWQICLAAGSGDPSPTTSTQLPPPAAPVAQTGSPGAVVKYETGDCRTHGGHVYECWFLANWPEHAVTELTGVPTKYYAPDTYDRSEHPGLAYEWELKFSDSSHQWDWAVRDFQGCYDALRVYFGEVPEAVGLKSLEFRLSDSREGSGEGDRTGMGLSSSYAFPETFWDWTFPDRPRATWQPSDLPHPDMARTSIKCFAPRGHPEDEVFCRIAPKWGNAGSINFEWTVAKAMSLAAEQMSRRAITYGYPPLRQAVVRPRRLPDTDHRRLQRPASWLRAVHATDARPIGSAVP